MSEEEQRNPAAKSGAEEVGTAGRPGTSSPCGLELTEAHLSAIAEKVVERLTAGKAAPDGQGVEFTRHAGQWCGVHSLNVTSLARLAQKWLGKGPIIGCIGQAVGVGHIGWPSTGQA